ADPSASMRGALTAVMRELFNLRPYSKQSAVDTHIIPAFKSKDLMERIHRINTEPDLEKRRHMCDVWRSYAMYLFDYLRDCPPKQAMSLLEGWGNEFRENGNFVVVTSNKGLVRCDGIIPIHFPNQT